MSYVGLLVVTMALSAPPAQVAVQGALNVDGTFDLTVALYPTETQGASLYAEKHTGVAVNNGVFHIQLGEQSPLPVKLFQEHGELWVGVSVQGEPELTRKPLSSVPWAMVAGNIACTGCIQESALPTTVAYVSLENVFEELQHFKAGIELHQQEARHMRFHNAAAPPAECGPQTQGMPWFNTQTKNLVLCNGKVWAPIVANTGTSLTTLKVDLVQYLDMRIDASPLANSNEYEPVDELSKARFEQAALALLNQAADTANQWAQMVGYHVIKLVDTGNSNELLYALLPTGNSAKGQGFYFVRPLASVTKALFLTAPHPHIDSRSGLAAAEVFQVTGARALGVSGTHRCANKTASGCSGSTSVCGKSEPYRESDMAHTEKSFFQVWHQVANDRFGAQSIHIQIHGMGSSSSDPEFSVSNGTSTNLDDPKHLSNLFASDLGARIAKAGSKKPGNSCNAPGDINKLCGSTNTQGRFTNGVAPNLVCTSSAQAANGRFVHAELSKALRYPSSKMGPKLVAETINAIVPSL